MKEFHEVVALEDLTDHLVAGHLQGLEVMTIEDVDASKVSVHWRAME